MASRDEITDALESLETHCPVRLMSPEGRARWIRDWCNDLSEFDIEIIRRSCREWRHGDNPKFPTVGQLRKLCIEKLKTASGEKPEPWRELSDQEYYDLPLAAKIRHRQIQAMTARTLAMQTLGKDRNIANMPPAGKVHLVRAQNYDADIVQLRGKMRSDFDF